MDNVSQSNQSSWRVLTEAEYAEEFGARKLRETLCEMTDNISRYFTCFGIENDDASIFMTLFNNSAAEKIQLHATEQ